MGLLIFSCQSYSAQENHLLKLFEFAVTNSEDVQYWYWWKAGGPRSHTWLLNLLLNFPASSRPNSRKKTSNVKGGFEGQSDARTLGHRELTGSSVPTSAASFQCLATGMRFHALLFCSFVPDQDVGAMKVRMEEDQRTIEKVWLLTLSDGFFKYVNSQPVALSQSVTKQAKKKRTCEQNRFVCSDWWLIWRRWKVDNRPIKA